jgi:rod shape-determining protein MreD
MRTATLVLIAYLMCVVVGAVWRVMPYGFVRDAVPDVAALSAAYLGLTARRGVAASVAGSVIVGYFADLISGAPPGFNALVLGLTCLVARAVQQRILVRGAAMTMGFSALIAVIAGVLAILVRVANHIPRSVLSFQLRELAWITVATALIGPLVWRVFRRIDAAFARTHRERDAALEGLAP